MKQLYANNAKTTLSVSVGTYDTALIVADGSRFPIPAGNEFFLVTLELGSSIEIMLASGRSGNTITIANRAQEGTIASSFSAGARVECRVTRDTLGRMSRNFAHVANVEALASPGHSYNDGYVCGTYDPYGNPVLAISKDEYTWRYLNYTPIYNSTTGSATTTSVTSTSAVILSSITSGKYLVQFTSGTLSGLIRPVVSVSGNTIHWSVPLPSVPAVSVTFEVVKSNASIISESMDSVDDTIIMPLLLGGE